jgi:hypothetical protein
VPLRPDLTIFGSDADWRAFAAAASPCDRAAARAYLEELGRRRAPSEED